MSETFQAQTTLAIMCGGLLVWLTIVLPMVVQ